MIDTTTTTPKGGDDAIMAGYEIVTADPAMEAEMLRQAAEQATDDRGETILAPVVALPEKAGGRELQTALAAVSAAAAGLDDLARTCLESDLVALLRDRKIPKPSDLAKAALKVDRTPTTEGDTSGFSLEPTEPHGEPVAGAEVLSSVEETLKRYIALPDGAAEAVALWLQHTYLIPSLQITPRLAFLSPTKRCGKSTALILASALAEKALPNSGVSAASIFRLMDAYRPTLIADEADTWLRESEDLRGIVNAGYLRRQAGIIRCVGDDHEPKIFNCFGAMCIAAIGALPDTIHDRSVVITMRRKLEGESVRQIRLDRLHLETDPLKAKMARWAADNAESVRQADPAIPRGLHDRAADCWRPLLSIADLAGGEWPDKARKAAVLLSGSAESDDTEIGTLLLADIRDVFELLEVEKISTAELRAELLKMDERPWPSYGRQEKEITTHALGKLIGRFKITSKTIRFADEFGNSKPQKGYERDQFRESWERYLPSRGGDPKVTKLQPSNGAGLSPKHKSNIDSDVTFAKSDETAPLRQCNFVTFEKGGTGEKNSFSDNGEPSPKVRRTI